MSNECSCLESRLGYNVPEHNIQIPQNLPNPEPLNIDYDNFPQNVIVPINNIENDAPQYVEQENILVVIPNEDSDDLDIIEIHADDDSLDNM